MPRIVKKTIYDFSFCSFSCKKLMRKNIYYLFCLIPSFLFTCVYYFIHNRTYIYLLSTYSQFKNACSLRESFCQKPLKSVLPFLFLIIFLCLLHMNANPIFPFIIDKHQLIMIIGIINHTTSKVILILYAIRKNKLFYTNVT